MLSQRAFMPGVVTCAGFKGGKISWRFVHLRLTRFKDLLTGFQGQWQSLLTICHVYALNFPSDSDVEYVVNEPTFLRQ